MPNPVAEYSFAGTWKFYGEEGGAAIPAAFTASLNASLLSPVAGSQLPSVVSAVASPATPSVGDSPATSAAAATLPSSINPADSALLLAGSPAVSSPAVSLPALSLPALSSPAVSSPAVSSPLAAPAVVIPSPAAPAVVIPPLAAPAVIIPSPASPAVVIPSPAAPAVIIPSPAAPPLADPLEMSGALAPENGLSREARIRAASRRRIIAPSGVALGICRLAGLPGAQSNVVYGSVDVRGRVNRRVSKRRADGGLVEGGRWPRTKTACTHDAVLYRQVLRGKSKKEVDELVGNGHNAHQFGPLVAEDLE